MFATAFGCANFVASATPTNSFSNTPTPTISPTISPPFVPSSDADAPLSGGWIFIIFVVCAGSVYLLGGMVYNHFKIGAWEPPNKHFWSSALGYVDDGVDFVINCDRRGRGGGGSSKSPFVPVGGVPAVSPYAAAGGVSGGYNAGAVGGYNAGGGSSSYTDL